MKLRLVVALAFLCALLVSLAGAHAASARSHAARPHSRCRMHYRRETIRVKRRVRRHHRWVVVRRHGRVVYVKRVECVRVRKSKRPARQAPGKTVEAAIDSGPMSVGMGDVSSIGCQGLPLQGATSVRIIVAYYDAPSRWLRCARDAFQAGYRVIVTIQYNNTASIAGDQAWFRTVLPLYAPYAWALSVGNEQELNQGGVQQNGYQYAAVWKAVEPIVATEAPNAVRVAGEISPWGLAFMEQAASAGLPGAQVFAMHPYPYDSPSPANFVHLAQQAGLPAWADEGLCGPGAWMTYGCRTASNLQALGFALASEWYATSAPTPEGQAPPPRSDPLPGTTQ